jgi:hypothetical protein
LKTLTFFFRLRLEKTCATDVRTGQRRDHSDADGRGA